MKLTFDMMQVANAIFADLAKNYGLSIVRCDESEFALQRNDYQLIIGIDYDGIYTSFFETGDANGYDISAFLLRSRSDKLTFLPHEVPASSHKEYVMRQLSALERHLSAAAQDILEGDRSWKRSYKLPLLKRSSS